MTITNDQSPRESPPREPSVEPADCFDRPAGPAREQLFLEMLHQRWSGITFTAHLGTILWIDGPTTDEIAAIALASGYYVGDVTTTFAAAGENLDARLTKPAHPISCEGDHPVIGGDERCGALRPHEIAVRRFISLTTQARAAVQFAHDYGFELDMADDIGGECGSYLRQCQSSLTDTDRNNTHLAQLATCLADAAQSTRCHPVDLLEQLGLTGLQALSAKARHTYAHPHPGGSSLPTR